MTYANYRELTRHLESFGLISGQDYLVPANVDFDHASLAPSILNLNLEGLAPELSQEVMRVIVHWGFLVICDKIDRGALHVVPQPDSIVSTPVSNYLF